MTTGMFLAIVLLIVIATVLFTAATGVLFYFVMKWAMGFQAKAMKSVFGDDDEFDEAMSNVPDLKTVTHN